MNTPFFGMINVLASDATLHAEGNAVEAALWILIGAVFAVFAMKGSATPRRRMYSIAGVFVLFGLSDVVEIQTGAWWNPWWLLVWKAACVLFFAWQYRLYRRNRAIAPGPDRRD